MRPNQRILCAALGLGLGFIASSTPLRAERVKCELHPDTRERYCAPEGGSIAFDRVSRRFECVKHGECIVDSAGEVRCTRKPGHEIRLDRADGRALCYRQETNRTIVKDSCEGGKPICIKDD